MKKNRGNEIFVAVALIAIGALFMIYKSEIISIAMTLIGVTFIVSGVVDILRKMTMIGGIKIVIGVLVLMAGWLFITLALYILGACLLVAGISEICRLSTIKTKKMTLALAMHYLQPVIYILVAICLFFNQGGALSWVFTVSGIFLIIDGIVALIGAFDK